MFEPSGDVRVLSTSLYDLYAGLTQAGFTEDQAMQAVLTIMREMARNTGNG